MKGSVGQMLRDARLEKNLTVDEVSRATKIRPVQIGYLESDDYSRFPNLAYARSFLFLYARHLGVDISQYPTVEPGSAVGLGDYQYLQNEEPNKASYSRKEPDEPPKKPRWLIGFFIFLLALAVGAYIGWVIMNYQRLGLGDRQNDAALLATPTPVPSAAPSPTATPEPSPTATPEPSPEAIAVPAPPAEVLAALSTPEPEVRPAQPVTQPNAEPVLPAEPVVTPAPAPAAVFPPPGAVRELKLRVTKRTRVRIVRDQPAASSVYYGYVNPAQPVLTYKGKYFWIQTTDPDAVQVTIEGQPSTGPESGVEIIRRPGL